MAYNIEMYQDLRYQIESLKGSVSDSKVDDILLNLEKLNKQILTNSVSDHPNDRQRDVDLIDIVYGYYKEINTDESNTFNRRNKSKDNKLYVAMLDIDNFGKFNKKYGESIGNLVLAKTAEIMKNTLRKEDIITKLSADSKSYHLHGEEKLIIFKSKSEKDAVNVADKVRSAIEKNSKEEVGYQVTESIGVTTWDFVNEGYLTAQGRADENMQIAKKEGKNRINFNDDSQVSSVNKSSDALNDLELNFSESDNMDNNLNENSDFDMGRRLGNGNQLYVMMFQINSFDQLKNTYNKDITNLLIKEVSHIATKTLRDFDLSCICDERCMVMYKCRTDADALKLAKKVTSAVKRESFYAHEYQTTNSFGLARWNPKIEGLSQAQGRALNIMGKYE